MKKRLPPVSPVSWMDYYPTDDYPTGYRVEPVDFYFWQSLVESHRLDGEIFSSEYHDTACVLEQLLCQGSLPLACMRCGHRLDDHQNTVVVGGSFCLSINCFDSKERSLCRDFVGPWVERR